MSLKYFFILLINIFLLHSCVDYQSIKTTKDKEKNYYSSKGFALIYENSLYKEKIITKKINNESMAVLHNSLKIGTPVEIINPVNSKVVETKIYRKAEFPKIFNLVVSKKIATILELDPNNPYIEIMEIKKNKTFIAKKSNIFDEEKNVAEKVPVDEIKVDDLTKNVSKTENKRSKKSNFILVINDFYYNDSAIDLMNEIIKKTQINNIYVKKINNTKYRLSVGPFTNFNALKNTYISLNNLGFEDLNIYSN